MDAQRRDVLGKNPVRQLTATLTPARGTLAGPASAGRRAGGGREKRSPTLMQHSAARSGDGSRLCRRYPQPQDER